MPFQKGNKLGRPGNRGGGRPPKQEIEIKKAARELAREFIEENVKPVLDNYLKLAQGYYETRYSENGSEYEVFVTDGPTTRHFIDKVIPEIKSDANSRPIAIQIIHEAQTKIVSSNGHGKTDIAVEGKGNGLAIHIGDE
jgi:hypothetical protein